MARPNRLQKLINRPISIQPSPPRGAPQPAAAATSSVTPVFVTKETIRTFAGATTAVWGIWIGLSLLLHVRASEVLWLGYLVSLAISLFLCWQAIADPRLDENAATRLSPYDKRVAFGLAIINSFQIFFALIP
ncbi:hypothetical protein [Microvirga puerhi]|uniref:Uncharacterized protein n=1 Tax=Microvirga puerhi TaxID=2876078 RepID=A0ABS7VKZ2_9HYPH|nr:hypothetical protein [Microvirga puerhi]MBZ6076202.1 hypothetical protein [Microvirga puerhi]